MRQLYVWLIAILFISCTAPENQPSIQPTDYYKKLDSACNNFIFKRTHDNIIDQVWSESKFSQLLQTDLHEITWLPGKVWGNSYDSSNGTREIILLDHNMHTFFIRTLNTKYTSSFKLMDSISIQGTMIGYHFDPKTNEDLAYPDFVAVADSIILLKRKK